MQETGIGREKNYRVKPFGYLMAGDEPYIRLWDDYCRGNKLGTEEALMEEIEENICSIDIPTEQRISGVRLREVESEEGFSLELWMYSVQDSETGRRMLEIESDRAYAPGFGIFEYELACEDEEDANFLLGTMIGGENVCCRVPAFGGRLAIRGQEEEGYDVSCELFLAVSWETAEDLVSKMFEVEEVTE